MRGKLPALRDNVHITHILVKDVADLRPAPEIIFKDRRKLYEKVGRIFPPVSVCFLPTERIQQLKVPLPRIDDLIGAAVRNGDILIDGISLRDYDLNSLRDQIAVVFQDNFLFSGTIRDNILLGLTDYTEEQLHNAVKSACLEEFVSELPKGLDTDIGERGSLLSGGQKQRIAIARAFMKNAPIVILDEATSALDNKSEAIVQQAIDNLMKNRTVLVIAHRLSTVQNADMIVVINEGKIVEKGSHDELLALNGEYAALYKMQFRKKEKTEE